MNKLERLGQSKLNERYFRLNTQEYTVYVEGDIDTLFWEDIFPKNNQWKPNIVILKKEDGTIIGGWKNLITYLENHINNKTKINYLIAIDGDYNSIINHKPSHKNLVITRKYNIENYLFCPKSLNKYMKKLSLGLFDNEIVIAKEMEKFCKMIKNLIILDCINEKEQLGIHVYDISQRELQNPKLLQKYIKAMTKEHSQIIKNNKNILDGYNLIDFIRWKCFLKQLNEMVNSIIRKIIETENKSRNNNNIRQLQKRKCDEGIHVFCIGNCTMCNSCDDYINLKKQAHNAFASLNLA